MELLKQCMLGRYDGNIGVDCRQCHYEKKVFEAQLQSTRAQIISLQDNHKIELDSFD